MYASNWCCGKTVICDIISYIINLQEHDTGNQILSMTLFPTASVFKNMLKISKCYINNIISSILLPSSFFKDIYEQNVLIIPCDVSMNKIIFLVWNIICEVSIWSSQTKKKQTNEQTNKNKQTNKKPTTGVFLCLLCRPLQDNIPCEHFKALLELSRRVLVELYNRLPWICDVMYRRVINNSAMKHVRRALTLLKNKGILSLK